MAKTIKNLPEIIENESQYGSALKLRQKAIGQFSLLGPPDLCYLTKEFQRSLNLSYNKPSFWGFYHYNYGLCPSTPAAVPAYVTKLLKDQEKKFYFFIFSDFIEFFFCKHLDSYKNSIMTHSFI